MLYHLLRFLLTTVLNSLSVRWKNNHLTYLHDIQKTIWTGKDLFICFCMGGYFNHPSEYPMWEDMVEIP